jgi:predicted RNase H-like nuclease (RuvC/YqgF family)
MKLIIKPEKGLGKIEVELSSEIWKEVERLSGHYGVPPERVIEIALTGEFKEPEGNVEELEKKVKELEERVWELEKEYAPLRFKAYGLSEDNKILAIELTGLMAENNQLRHFLKLPLRRDIELRKLISYYMR